MFIWVTLCAFQKCHYPNGVFTRSLKNDGSELLESASDIYSMHVCNIDLFERISSNNYSTRRMFDISRVSNIRSNSNIDGYKKSNIRSNSNNQKEPCANIVLRSNNFNRISKALQIFKHRNWLEQIIWLFEYPNKRKMVLIRVPIIQKNADRFNRSKMCGIKFTRWLFRTTKLHKSTTRVCMHAFIYVHECMCLVSSTNFLCSTHWFTLSSSHLLRMEWRPPACNSNKNWRQKYGR